MNLNNDDTIAAISTPPGEGGIAVIRLSGKSSRAIADLVFRGKVLPSLMDTHTVHLGQITNPLSGEFLDEVLLTAMWAPNSYTAEDVIEISSHGGPLVAGKILRLLLQNGARHAQPGEYTRRAFLNGRIDLAQAEAVADMISARTERGLQAAAEQLEGRLSLKINTLKESLLGLLALLEAYIDFPEEIPADKEQGKINHDLEEIKKEIINLINSYEEGKILKNGLKIPIVGPPNVGKSSLFNRLLQENRTIVTDIPGTTRDTVSEYLNVAGIPVELIDTAGLRQSGDLVEAEGIRRAHEEIKKADLVLALVEMTDPNILDQIKALRQALGNTHHLLLANKADLLETEILQARLVALTEYKLLPISAQTGMGLDQVQESIAQTAHDLTKSGSRGEIIITSARHRDALCKSLDALSKVSQGLEEEFSFEFLSFDLRKAADALEEIIGKTIPDDILNIIFSQFCIGK